MTKQSSLEECLKKVEEYITKIQTSCVSGSEKLPLVFCFLQDETLKMKKSAFLLSPSNKKWI